MKFSRWVAAALGVLVLALAACGGTAGDGQIVDLAIDCTVAYRAGAGQPLGEETFTLNAGAGEQTLAFDDLHFQAVYDPSDDPPRERAMRVSVSLAEGGQQLTSQLFQMPLDERPRNQFIGGHGFTGLHYVYHPDGGGELQYFCAVADGG